MPNLERQQSQELRSTRGSCSSPQSSATHVGGCDPVQYASSCAHRAFAVVTRALCQLEIPCSRRGRGRTEPEDTEEAECDDVGLRRDAAEACGKSGVRASSDIHEAKRCSASIPSEGRWGVSASPHVSGPRARSGLTQASLRMAPAFTPHPNPSPAPCRGWYIGKSPTNRHGRPRRHGACTRPSNSRKQEVRARQCVPYPQDRDGSP